MTEQSIGMIGGGRVATILLGGFARAGRMPGKVVVSDPDEQVLNRLKARHATIAVAQGDNSSAAAQNVVFLAVHPPVYKEVLPEIRSSLRSDSVVISLAPKLTIARLSEMLGGFHRIARMIPNAPSIIGRGYNPVCFAPALTEAEKSDLTTLFSALGNCPVVAEEKLEAYAILTAMGPTYFWFQFCELLRLAESFGLTPGEAREGLTEMIEGAIRTLTESGMEADEILDLIPVKPLADLEPSVTDAYRAKLTAIMDKIRP